MQSYRKTCRRINEPGHAHALTFSCFQRRPFLSKDRSRQWLIDSINAARTKHGFHIWAYVIMPEHVHLLLWPATKTYSVSSILTSIKQPVTRAAIVFLQQAAPAFLERMADRRPNGKVHHRFWQRGGGYDRNIVEPSTMWKQIEYIHANPVRRGLCERSVDWFWSGASEYEHPGTGPLSVDLSSLPR